jgi:hypothetical protein
VDAPLEEPAPAAVKTAVATEQGLRIFISHSSEDVTLADLLIRVLEAGVECPTGTIRCTSVHGYNLEGGDDAPDVLRENLRACPVVLGMITKASKASSYVLMELGAAWAFEKRAIPLIGPGAEFKDLPGPFKDLHALSMSDSANMFGLIKTIMKVTGLKDAQNSPKLAKAVDAFKAEAERLAALGVAAPRPFDLERKADRITASAFLKLLDSNWMVSWESQQSDNYAKRDDLNRFDRYLIETQKPERAFRDNVLATLHTAFVNAVKQFRSDVSYTMVLDGGEAGDMVSSVKKEGTGRWIDDYDKLYGVQTRRISDSTQAVWAAWGSYISSLSVTFPELMARKPKTKKRTKAKKASP